jgi:hypothetical protein
MNRINQYLLTHYPLLWNTRVVWVLLTNFIIHVLFFLSGLAAVSATTLKNYSRISSVGGQGMYTMAALCALVVIIVWCIYYLRNNAFKSFYRIGKWYLAKEYAIIFVIILTSLCYSVSFEYGVKVRVRNITDKMEMVQEVNAVNQAMVYVPLDKEQYFILNTCEEQDKRTALQNRMLIAEEPSYSYDTVDSVRYKEAMQKPDAYSYLHYCRSFIYYRDYTIDSAEIISNRNKQWLTAQQQQVKQSVTRLTSILNKYAIIYSLNTDELINAVFTNQYFNVGAIIPQSEYSYEYGTQTRNKYFLETNDLTGVYSFIDDCQPTAKNFADYKITWNIIGYLSLSLSILLLCYRRFSKRVFLISVVGTLVWAILVGLMSVGSGSAVSFLSILLMLFVIFLGVALVSLKSKGSKTAAGITLNWQGYLSPFVVMLIVGLINDYHSKLSYGYYNYSRSEKWLAEHYPFSNWVVNHTQEIFLVNIILVALYTAFAFNHWAKKWHLLREE